MVGKASSSWAFWGAEGAQTCASAAETGSWWFHATCWCSHRTSSSAAATSFLFGPDRGPKTAGKRDGYSGHYSWPIPEKAKKVKIKEEKAAKPVEEKALEPRPVPVEGLDYACKSAPEGWVPPSAGRKEHCFWGNPNLFPGDFPRRLPPKMLPPPVHTDVYSLETMPESRYSEEILRA